VHRAPIAFARGGREIVAPRLQAERPVEAEHLHVEIERAHLGGAARIVRERVDEAAQARRLLDDLRVREHHPPRAAPRDGEDLQLEAAAALPLEQRGIAPGAGHPEDLLLRLRRLGGGVLDHAAPDGRALVAVDERPVHQLAVDLERELLDLRARREREAEDPLELLVGVVGERLVDLGARDEVDDADLHRVLREAHRALLLARLPGLPRPELAQAAQHGRVDVLGLVVAPLHHVGEGRGARHHGLGVAGDHGLLARAHLHRPARVGADADVAARDLDGGAAVARGDRELRGRARAPALTGAGGAHLDLAARKRDARRGAVDVRHVGDDGAARDAGRAVLALHELDLGGAIDREIRPVGERHVRPRARVGA
jgi:hypothetical protein